MIVPYAKVLILAILCLCTHLHAAESFEEILTEAESKQFNSSDIFLRKMGYEDYSQMAQDTLDSQKNIHPVAELALKRNADYLGSLNSSRNFANAIYVALYRMDPSKLNQEDLSRIHLLVQIIVQQLSPFPLFTLEPIPQKEIQAIKKLNVSAAMDYKRNYFRERGVARLSQEKSHLVSASLNIINPEAEFVQPVISWLDHTALGALMDSYTLERRQQNRFLGRALILTLMRYIRLNKLTELEKYLVNELRKNNLYIGNYIHAQYITNLGKDDLRGYNLKSGDIALEYSHGQEAFFTSLLVQPRKAADKSISELYRLSNRVLDARKFLDTSTYYELLDKKDVYVELSAKEKEVYDDYWSRDYSNGYSHSGIVEVKTDEETEISMAWIWDIYPEKDKIGVVRLLTPEGFSYAERHLKIGFLSLDPDKVFKSFQRQIQKRGYLEDIWQGYGSFVGTYSDGETGPSADMDEIYVWKTYIDKKTVMDWSQLNPNNAAVWYSQQVLPRVFSRIKSYVYSKDAKVFADGLLSARSMLYCSQMVLMSFLEGANLDLQEEPEELIYLVKAINSIKKNKHTIDTKYRFVSPNGLVWQSHLFKNLYSTYHSRERVLKQETQLSPTVADAYTNQFENLLVKFPLKIDASKLSGIPKELMALDFAD